MDVLAFDGRMGASGDMLLGALVAAGADSTALDPIEDALDLRYVVGETTKNGIRATTVDVVLAADGTGRSDGHGHDHGHDHDDSHVHEHGRGHASDPTPEDGVDHSHGHGDDHTAGDHQGHGHEHAHASNHEHAHRPVHDHAEGAGPHRTYGEVVDLVADMGLPDAVEADALAIFEILGEAEAAVHGTDLASTHFHEVGADDAVADVVGTALLLADLDPDRVVTTPLATGGGEVEMSHGRYPVPPPAVVEIAEAADWSIVGGPVEAELLTPTGAAILAHVAEGVDALPSIRVSASGYGAGDRDFPEHPNVLRALVGDGGGSDGASGRSTAAFDDAGDRGGLLRDEIRVLETNVDDVSPEVLGGLHDSLAEAGARDVSIVPLSMKKSRPGHLVSVIVKPEDAERVARRLAEETGTLGVRESGARHRWIATREVETVSVEVDGEFHEVGVKVAADEAGAVYDVSAEYDDAAALAREAGVPVREVLRMAERAYRDDAADG